MGGFAGGFIKGIVVGVAAFGVGFAALSVILPPDTDQPTAVPAGDAPPDPPPAPPAEEPGATLPPLAPPPPAEPDDAAAPDNAEPAPVEQPTASTPETAPLTAEPAPSAPDPDTVSAPRAPSAPDLPQAELGPERDLPASAAADPEAAPAVRAPAALDRPASEAEAPSGRLPRIGEAPPPVASPDDGSPDDESTAPVAPEEMEALADAVSEPEDPAPLLRPGTGLAREVEGVVTGRLPSIDAAEPEAEAEMPAAEAEAQATPDPDPAADAEQPAHIRFAAPHDTESDLPRLSVILVDTQADAEAEAAILGLGFPVSVALDAADEDAPRRAAAYREAGHEVMILASGLPPRATASDIEITVSAWSAALPEAVALLDPSGDGLQGNAMLARQVMPALAERGLGLVLPGGGLGGARQAARSEGVVNAVIFREIDQGSENRFTIRRFIDRAVFEAQRQGGVTVLGRAAHPETLAALELWRTEGRVDAVTVVPASAQLELD